MTKMPVDIRLSRVRSRRIIREARTKELVVDYLSCLGIRVKQSRIIADLDISEERVRVALRDLRLEGKVRYIQQRWSI